MRDETNTPDRDGEAEEPRSSVLSELPRRRPQRRSSKRESAGTSGRETTTEEPNGAGEKQGKQGTEKPSRDTKKPGPRRSGQRQTQGRSKQTERPGKQAERPGKQAEGPSKRAEGPSKRAQAGRDKQAPARGRKRTPAQTTVETRDAGSPAPAPRQGFEPDDDLGRAPVSPPSAAELVGSLAELAGELAQTGIAASGRLLKGILNRP